MKRLISALTYAALSCLLVTAPAAMADDGPKGEKRAAHAAKEYRQDSGDSAKKSALTQHARPVYCGDVLSEPGVYRLDTDLECTASIQITGSNVHLDFAGHSLTCVPEAWQYPEPLGVPEEDRHVWVKGVNVNFNDFEDPSQEPVVNGVHIRNGTIRNCAQGILLYKADRSFVTRMTLENNVLDAACCWARGIEVVESNNNKIRRNTFLGNSQGVALFSSSGNVLAANLVQDNLQDGVILVASDSNRLVRNTAKSNGWGVWLDGSSNNMIKANVANSNANDGIIVVPGSDGNVITDNETNDNQSTGIALIGYLVAGESIGLPISAENLLKGNMALGNGSVDVGEANLNFSDFTFSSFEVEVDDTCHNTWLKNDYETAIGAPDCID